MTSHPDQQYTQKPTCLNTSQHLIPFFAGPHLAFLANRIGLSLKTMRAVHRSAGFLTAELFSFMRYWWRLAAPSRLAWAANERDSLDLLIEPQRCLTRELLYHAKKGYTINPIIMFSGPHGTDVSMDKYESVLMAASGFRHRCCPAPPEEADLGL
jgi:hypothetical protein